MGEWVNQFFLCGRDIWDCTARKDDSPLLKKLLDIRDLFLQPQQSDLVAGNGLPTDATVNSSRQNAANDKLVIDTAEGRFSDSVAYDRL